jgi:hypothetical protein
MRRLILLAIAALALPACAQVFDMERDRVQMAALDGMMRFHTGDDPRWSDPAFDDSAWPLISSESDWSAQGYKDYSGFAWYRFKVILPLDHRQLGLFIPHILTSYQVFADGQIVGSFGGFPPRANIYDIHQHMVLLPPEQGGQMKIAIRVWHRPQWAMYIGGGIQGEPRIGDAGQLRDWMMLQDKNTFWEQSAQNLSALLCFLYGGTGFALFLMRPKERVYLWFGLSGIIFGTHSLIYAYAAFHDLPLFVGDALPYILGGAGFFSFVMFVWLLLGAERTVWVWAAAASLVLHTAMLILPAARHLPISVGNLIFSVVDLPFLIGPVVMLIEGAKRGDPNARLLLIPVGFNALANLINDILTVILTAGHAWIKPIWTFWDRTFSWPFTFGLYDLSIWIILIANLGIVVLWFARSRREEEHLQSEMEAARAVQQMLIPEKIPHILGFRIESAYKPARQVGGDFFYIRPEEAGGVLVVVGDVSGKGLRAAMTVNSVIGALRTMSSLAPARILGDLNRGLVGQMQGGFVTCCVARIDQDGNVTIANAGHLPPYSDGVEAPVLAGLPLGIAAGAEYEESGFFLRPGSTLTLVSDGVVEARNAQGELFGFERTAAISSESAESIARAASTFGQEDDITVLTLELVATGVAHA